MTPDNEGKRISAQRMMEHMRSLGGEESIHAFFAQCWEDVFGSGQYHNVSSNWQLTESKDCPPVASMHFVAIRDGRIEAFSMGENKDKLTRMKHIRIMQNSLKAIPLKTELSPSQEARLAQRVGNLGFRVLAMFAYHLDPKSGKDAVMLHYPGVYGEIPAIEGITPNEVSVALARHFLDAYPFPENPGPGFHMDLPQPNLPTSPETETR